MSNSIVLVFTNYGKWNNLSDLIKDRVNYDEWNLSYQNIENNHVLRYSLNQGTCTLTEARQLSDSNIYLIYDSISNEELTTLLENCHNSNLYVLTHSTGAIKCDWFIARENCIQREGRHTNEQADFYYPLFDILTDKESEKTTRIINNVFKPINEIADKFLDYSMSPGNITEEFYTAYEILRKNPCLTNCIDEFVELYEQCNTFESYQDEWKKIRDLIQDLF